MLESRKIRFGVQVRTGPLSDVVQQSILCEKSGFDSVWHPDHLIGGHPASVWPELYTTLTMMGINTSRVTVGSAVTDSLRRHPATIAQSLATVDNILGGRTALGIGAGEAMNLIPFGISMRNLYRKLREAILIIKLLWTVDQSKPANFEGHFYRLKKAFLQIEPCRKAHPPIYVGAFGPKMLEMTGELADGWIPFSHTPETYKKCLNGPIKRGAEKACRSLSEIEPAFLPLTSISRDYDQAKKDVERAAKRFLVLLPSVLKMIAPQVEHPGAPYTLTRWMGHLRKEDMKVISEIAEEVPTELALKTVIWGTPDDCIGQIENFIEAGCRHFIFGIRGKNLYEAIQLLGTKVVSYFKEKEIK